MTTAKQNATLQNIIHAYDHDEFTFADFMVECVTEECHVLHQALVNIEERENAAIVWKSIEAHYEEEAAARRALGYGEPIYAG